MGFPFPLLPLWLFPPPHFLPSSLRKRVLFSGQHRVSRATRRPLLPRPALAASGLLARGHPPGAGGGEDAKKGKSPKSSPAQRPREKPQVSGKVIPSQQHTEELKASRAEACELLAQLVSVLLLAPDPLCLLHKQWLGLQDPASG